MRSKCVSIEIIAKGRGYHPFLVFTVACINNYIFAYRFGNNSRKELPVKLSKRDYLIFLLFSVFSQNKL